MRLRGWTEQRLSSTSLRVAAPSVCFGPWCGPRILQAAARASPPCFRRWRRSALLLFKSRCGDRKRPAHECEAAHPAPESKRQSPTIDIPEDWDPRAKQQPTGLIACSAAPPSSCACQFFRSPGQGLEKLERGPSLASLFPPLAAVGSAAVHIPRPTK